MTTQTDNLHVEGCHCPNCTWGITKPTLPKPAAQPVAAMPPRPVTQPADTDILFDVKDYAKRIHWWVRLFGVVWLVSLAMTAVVSMFVVARLTADRPDTRSAAYEACLRNPGTTIAMCSALYGN